MDAMRKAIIVDMAMTPWVEYLEKHKGKLKAGEKARIKKALQIMMMQDAGYNEVLKSLE